MVPVLECCRQTAAVSSWIVTVNIAVAKTMTPNGSIRFFPTGSLSGFFLSISGDVMNMMHPLTMSRHESIALEMIFSDPLKTAATILMMPRQTLTPKLPEFATRVLRVSQPWRDLQSLVESLSSTGSSNSASTKRFWCL